MVNPSTVLVVYGCPLTYPYADFRFDIVQLARKILMLPFSNSFRFLSHLVFGKFDMTLAPSVKSRECT